MPSSRCAAGRGGQQAAAVGGVDVHPGAVRRRTARRSRAAGRWSRSRWCRRWRRRPWVPGRRWWQRVQLARPGATVRIRLSSSAGDRDDGVRAEAEQGGGLLHAEVAALGGEDPQPGQDLGAGSPSTVRRRRPPRGRAACAWRLDWVPPLVNTPSAAGAEADPLGGPVDQPALDEGAAGALVPGVQRGVDGGEHRLAEQRPG